jgi:hypothetical protein
MAIDVSYFINSGRLEETISEAEKRNIVNSTDYRVKCAVTSYRRTLSETDNKDIAAQYASDYLEPQDNERFLEVMLALELCNLNVL